MAVKNLELPIFHFDDPDTGTPLAGGKVYVYAAGTTTSINTWQDFDQTTLNANPVVLDSYGNAKIWFDRTAKIVVKSSDDTTTYFTFDDVSPSGGTTVITGEYNLCQNGSFESSDSDSTPSQWTVTLNDPTSSITVDTTNVAHGQYSAKFDGQTTYGAGKIASQRFDVPAGERVQVSLYYMVSDADTENDVTLYWYQKDDTTASSTASTTLGLPAAGSHPTSMTGYTFTVDVPSDATRAYIEIDAIKSSSTNTAADAYFDDVVVLDHRSHNPEIVAMVYNNAGYAHSTEIYQFDTETVDTHGYFDTGTYRFTPLTAGYYSVVVRSVASASINADIRKNGTVVAYGAVDAAFHTIASALVYCNGTTDYITGFGTGAGNITGGATQTYMHIHLVRNGS